MSAGEWSFRSILDCSICCLLWKRNESDPTGSVSAIPMEDRKTIADRASFDFRRITSTPTREPSLIPTPERTSIKRNPLPNSLFTLEEPLIPISNTLSQTEEDFKTVNSSDGRSMSRKSFRLLGKKSSQQIVVGEFEEAIVAGYLLHSDNSNYMMGGNTSQQQEELMASHYEWLFTQYNPVGVAMKPLDPMNQFRVDAHNYFKTMICRMEDYYTFIHDSAKGQFVSEHLRGSYCASDEGGFLSGGPHQKYLSLSVIEGPIDNPAPILRWLNSQQVQAILSCFYNIEVYPPNKHPPSCVVVRCQQFSKQMRGLKDYRFVKQLTYAHFEGTQAPSLLQVEFNVDGSSFDRLIRIDPGDRGTIEIYTESCEEIAGSPRTYFEKSWSLLAARLKRDRIFQSRLMHS